LDRCHANPDHQLDEEDIKQVVEAKWLMGMSEFTEEEMVFVRARFGKIKGNDDQIKREKLFCERFGTPEQIALMDKILA
jgi:hypothetical protein